MKTPLLRIAIQKSGRLFEESKELLNRAGIYFDHKSRRLLVGARGFDAEIMLVRDDDIPHYVTDAICDLGIVGQNVLTESPNQPQRWVQRKELGFGKCRLSIAVPKGQEERSLQGLKIATSYPGALQSYLQKHSVTADVVEISGAVEIAPALGVADAICDIVSTGGTLKSNGLVETDVILRSEAVLISAPSIRPEIASLVERLENRIDGVLKARASKYIMMNAPKDKIEAIAAVLPGVQSPTVVNLQGSNNTVALHAVATEDVFWETMEKLKELGASGILVVPIEKMID